MANTADGQAAAADGTAADGTVVRTDESGSAATSDGNETVSTSKVPPTPIPTSAPPTPITTSAPPSPAPTTTDAPTTASPAPSTPAPTVPSSPQPTTLAPASPGPPTPFPPPPPTAPTPTTARPLATTEEPSSTPAPSTGEPTTAVPTTNIVATTTTTTSAPPTTTTTTTTPVPTIVSPPKTPPTNGPPPSPTANTPSASGPDPLVSTTTNAPQPPPSRLTPIPFTPFPATPALQFTLAPPPAKNSEAAAPYARPEMTFSRLVASVDTGGADSMPTGAATNQCRLDVVYDVLPATAERRYFNLYIRDSSSSPSPSTDDSRLVAQDDDRTFWAVQNAALLSAAEVEARRAMSGASSSTSSTSLKASATFKIWCGAKSSDFIEIDWSALPETSKSQAALAASQPHRWMRISVYEATVAIGINGFGLLLPSDVAAAASSSTTPASSSRRRQQPQPPAATETETQLLLADDMRIPAEELSIPNPRVLSLIDAAFPSNPCPLHRDYACNLRDALQFIKKRWSVEEWEMPAANISFQQIERDVQVDPLSTQPQPTAEYVSRELALFGSNPPANSPSRSDSPPSPRMPIQSVFTFLTAITNTTTAPSAALQYANGTDLCKLALFSIPQGCAVSLFTRNHIVAVIAAELLTNDGCHLTVRQDVRQGVDWEGEGTDEEVVMNTTTGLLSGGTFLHGFAANGLVTRCLKRARCGWQSYCHKFQRNASFAAAIGSPEEGDFCATLSACRGVAIGTGHQLMHNGSMIASCRRGAGNNTRPWWLTLVASKQVVVEALQEQRSIPTSSNDAAAATTLVVLSQVRVTYTNATFLGSHPSILFTADPNDPAAAQTQQSDSDLFISDSGVADRLGFAFVKVSRTQPAAVRANGEGQRGFDFGVLLSVQALVRSPTGGSMVYGCPHSSQSPAMATATSSTSSPLAAQCNGITDDFARMACVQDVLATNSTALIAAAQSVEAMEGDVTQSEEPPEGYNPSLAGHLRDLVVYKGPGHRLPPAAIYFLALLCCALLLLAIVAALNAFTVSPRKRERRAIWEAAKRNSRFTEGRRLVATESSSNEKAAGDDDNKANLSDGGESAESYHESEDETLRASAQALAQERVLRRIAANRERRRQEREHRQRQAETHRRVAIAIGEESDREEATARQSACAEEMRSGGRLVAAFEPRVLKRDLPPLMSAYMDETGCVQAPRPSQDNRRRHSLAAPTGQGEDQPQRHSAAGSSSSGDRHAAGFRRTHSGQRGDTSATAAVPPPPPPPPAFFGSFHPDQALEAASSPNGLISLATGGGGVLSAPGSSRYASTTDGGGTTQRSDRPHQRLQMPGRVSGVGGSAVGDDDSRSPVVAQRTASSFSRTMLPAFGAHLKGDRFDSPSTSVGTIGDYGSPVPSARHNNDNEEREVAPFGGRQPMACLRLDQHSSAMSPMGSARPQPHNGVKPPPEILGGPMPRLFPPSALEQQPRLPPPPLPLPPLLRISAGEREQRKTNTHKSNNNDDDASSLASSAFDGADGDNSDSSFGGVCEQTPMTDTLQEVYLEDVSGMQ